MSTSTDTLTRLIKFGGFVYSAMIVIVVRGNSVPLSQPMHPKLGLTSILLHSRYVLNGRAISLGIFKNKEEVLACRVQHHCELFMLICPLMFICKVNYLPFASMMMTLLPLATRLIDLIFLSCLGNKRGLNRMQGRHTHSVPQGGKAYGIIRGENCKRFSVSFV